MLARLTLLLIALPALALAADGGAPPSGKIRLPQKPAAPATVVQAPAVQPAATVPVIRPGAPIGAAPADGGACRMDCAQTYYFCRAGDHVDECASEWSQCLSSCNSPNLRFAPGFSTRP
ncbi:MAG TPA: hypothetical protein VFE13_15320 [Caulobacteraceae bacterium]|jgi:hypothetical protein|nr:hypothetical protein [Caulobacteraceae bacterium]